MFRNDAHDVQEKQRKLLHIGTQSGTSSLSYNLIINFSCYAIY